jgi:hypothetical protein
MNLTFIAFAATVAAIRVWGARRLAPMSARVWPISFVRSLFAAFVLIFATLLFSSQLALAQFTQQGPKLVGTGAVGPAGQGFSVALSSDGNLAIVGGPEDNSNAGTVWVYTRSGGVWTQQGDKLVGTGAVGNGSVIAQQGFSVALSGDGNTTLVGGRTDNSQAGAAWVFTRSGGVWTQQGTKLVGTGAVGPAGQGFSVALSSDGNLAIVGGPEDNSNAGAVWVYTRPEVLAWANAAGAKQSDGTPIASTFFLEVAWTTES